MSQQQLPPGVDPRQAVDAIVEQARRSREKSRADRAKLLKGIAVWAAIVVVLWMVSCIAGVSGWPVT